MFIISSDFLNFLLWVGAGGCPSLAIIMYFQSRNILFFVLKYVILSVLWVKSEIVNYIFLQFQFFLWVGIRYRFIFSGNNLFPVSWNMSCFFCHEICHICSKGVISFSCIFSGCNYLFPVSWHIPHNMLHFSFFPYLKNHNFSI